MTESTRKGPKTRRAPYKFDEKRRHIVIEALRLGSYNIVACQLAGISRRCFDEWMTLGREDLAAGKKSRFSDFAEKVIEATAVSETAALSKIRKAKDWQSAAWYLERKFPAKWGKKPREVAELSEMEADGELEKKKRDAVLDALDLDKMSPEELAVARKIIKTLAGDNA